MIKINPNSHLISNIPYLESQNCDTRPEGIDIDTIIIHCISLPDGEYGNDNVNYLLRVSVRPSLNAGEMLQIKFTPCVMAMHFDSTTGILCGNCTEFMWKSSEFMWKQLELMYDMIISHENTVHSCP